MNRAEDKFTKYEIARIIGARALQIAMDAPLLLKMSGEELKKINYNALKIAEKELEEDVLPITIHRPTPIKGKERLETIREDTISDEELIEKAKEVEKEIVENPEEYALVEEDEESPEEATASKEET